MASLKQMTALWRGLMDGEKAYGGPLLIALDTVRWCNNVCLGCFYHSEERRQFVSGDINIRAIPLDVVRRLAEGIRKRHPNYGEEQVKPFVVSLAFIQDDFHLNSYLVAIQ